jgi:hypothetical protein
MASSGMLRCVALLRTDALEELSASFIKVQVSVNQENAFVFLRKVFRLPVTANFLPGSPILDTLMKEVLSSSETFVLSEPHGITSQKMTFFIVTAVKTSNLTQTFIFQKTQFCYCRYTATVPE